ncbi:bifunctional diaminohydroxyphosphoribosylaminopyrimidine deaminase/5-amino-6-(5-phosphoribosylamino)uracil reductase RibD [Rhizobium sp. PAMB 3182]
MGFTPEDRRFMAAALSTGRRHQGLTGSNPSVGCIIVKDGSIVARAVTARGGRPHAETQALELAGEAARGATAYVTLEPCSHHGRTPPCADALVAAGIVRVVVAVPDPDARVSGRGLKRLEEAGIRVETGLMEREGARDLSGYLLRQTKKRPQVILKMAISADGKIGRLGTGQVAITGAEVRVEVHRLRAKCDAIMIGIGTALADDPELTCRIPDWQDRSPQRIVLDRRLDLPLGSKLVRSAGDVPVIAVAGSEDFPEFETRKAALVDAGVEVVSCAPDDPLALLEALASRGISTIMLEGGARTVERFLSAGLIDCAILYSGPGEIGEGGIAAPLDPSHMPDEFRLVRTGNIGADLRRIFERVA